MSEKNYKDTLCLPKTDFPMKADLTAREPQRLEHWEREKLYQRVLRRRIDQKAPTYILHDGPPFANGDVHMGTALNKILKDFVIKTKTMSGFAAPYVPGWDCHGLPIEYKVVKETAGLSTAEIRRRCDEFADKYIDVQRGTFRRLGVLGAWSEPYLTKAPKYEADVLRVFAKLVESGAVYRGKKPVQWSYGAKTALAEAEVEYVDKVSTAVYVKFSLKEKLLGREAAVAIWTTTPWTLPSNLALAVHPNFDYVLGAFRNDEKNDVATLLVARGLLGDFAAKTGYVLSEEFGEMKGESLVGKRAKHPFLTRDSPVIAADFVTLDAGSGVVHVAPGHGADDFIAGRQNGLDVLSPVNDDGCFTEEVGVPELVGMHVFKANKRIVEILLEHGALLGSEEYRHSYPHCWRSKTPVIFRAVEQFFISMDKLKPQALEAIDKVNWLPSWGRNRIYGTVENRPDWCISRQRTWGVPTPAFFAPDGEIIMSADLIRKVADMTEKEGGAAWFEKSDEEMAKLFGLQAGTKRCFDTLDVWIDSGCSHVAVLERTPLLHAPCDLYLEATDQHRGWFQSSLMLSIAWRGTAPYKTVMTHGFVVDKDRKKLSKSDAAKSGKPIDVAHFIDKYGADIVRLWVSSVDWQNEVPFGEELFKQVTEPYRRMRNSLRILLGNLDGYDAVLAEQAEYTLLDRWILERFNEVVRECREAYEAFEFRKAFNALNNFCTHDLSAVYIDATKDRMYCDAVKAPRRLASQKAMKHIFVGLAKLMAPILAYTADEAWECATFLEGSVHEQDFPQVDEKLAQGEAIKLVERLFAIKYAVQVAIEAAVQAKIFTRNNEASVLLTVADESPEIMALLQDRDFYSEFFIISELQVRHGAELQAEAQKTSYQLCPRCRKHEPLSKDGLCARCEDVILTTNK